MRFVKIETQRSHYL